MNKEGVDAYKAGRELVDQYMTRTMEGFGKEMKEDSLEFVRNHLINLLDYVDELERT